MDQLPRDHRKVPGIKIPFFSIRKPEPEGLRCVRVYIPDDDEFKRQLLGLIYQTTRWYNYERDPDHTGAALAKLWLKAFNHPKFLEACCMCMDCGEMQECLAPLFEGIQATLEALQAEVEAGNNALKVTNPAPVQAPNCGANSGAIMAGCKAAVQQVNDVIMAIYNRAEGELPDDLFEWAKNLIGAIPGLGSLPFDELYGLANEYFENQVETYEDAYNADNFIQLAACSLFCMIVDNDCTLDAGTVGEWLKTCDELVEGNIAGKMFAKFGDATEPTFINQIGNFLNSIRGGQSLKQFFDDILTAFGVGSQGTDGSWVDCGCGQTVDVEATTDWVEASEFPGIVVTEGTFYRVTATGETTGWGGTADADGAPDTAPVALFPNVLANAGQLCGYIEDGAGGSDWIRFGVDTTFTADRNGTLHFAIADSTGNYGNNTGTLVVALEAI